MYLAKALVDQTLRDIHKCTEVFNMLTNMQFLTLLDGYTSANFSGRMPMAELADAIVQTGIRL